ncbi:MAG: hypothetical protein JSR66_17150 [Proteobacteria bacterium]|nr:hypothetical protein [Pseudomonadota bacterium]
MAVKLPCPGFDLKDLMLQAVGPTASFIFAAGIFRSYPPPTTAARRNKTDARI